MHCMHATSRMITRAVLKPAWGGTAQASEADAWSTRMWRAGPHKPPDARTAAGLRCWALRWPLHVGWRVRRPGGGGCVLSRTGGEARMHGGGVRTVEDRQVDNPTSPGALRALFLGVHIDVDELGDGDDDGDHKHNEGAEDAPGKQAAQAALPPTPGHIAPQHLHACMRCMRFHPRHAT